MAIVKGENMILSIGSSVISCWRSCTLAISAETVGISTVGSGNWQEVEAVNLSYSLNAEGQIWVNESFTVHDLYDLQIQLEPIIFSFDVDSTIFYTGSAIITNISINGNVNDIGSFSLELQGKGELIKTP